MLAVFSTSLEAFSALTAEPNPPEWPTSVTVFGPSDTGIDGKIADAYAENGGHQPANHGQFSSSRFAFLFKPGSYGVDVPVGYYTQILGLGATPADVTFTSPKGVYSEEQDYTIGGALSTFWRSAENFRSSATQDWQVGKGMMWAVSQVSRSPPRHHRLFDSHCVCLGTLTSALATRVPGRAAASHRGRQRLAALRVPTAHSCGRRGLGRVHGQRQGRHGPSHRCECDSCGWAAWRRAWVAAAVVLARLDGGRVGRRRVEHGLLWRAGAAGGACGDGGRHFVRLSHMASRSG